ncbi:Ceramide synthetase [Spironucleus salmonicida]|uniref:Ceramide synthetase n=1 Tax=Spironucleus salmonicida TaxID=348837 RepID=V6LWL3_9EUKA|nr:Ceramide synthetase [Spironucleus salmonicida]|eukprot:EST48970.1 Transmembrane domain-containing protein [Spironucleus salmonicida]
MVQLPVSPIHFAPIIYLTPIIFLIRLSIVNMTKSLLLNRYSLKRSQKAAESFYYLIQYTVLFLFSKHLINKTGIAPFSLENFFQFYPQRLHFDSLYSLFFSTEISVYLVSLLFLKLETRTENTDFKEMILHHFITFSLIFTGYSRRHFEYSLLVANLHDVTDLFLESSKVLNYLLGEPVSVISFVMFAVAFFITRIIIFPCYLILPIVNGVGSTYMHNDEIQFSFMERLWFVVILSSLWAIDCYWMSQIVRMIRGMVRLEIHGDIRDREECSGALKDD